jgi:SOS response associated peptidase (SRAP)
VRERWPEGAAVRRQARASAAQTGTRAAHQQSRSNGTPLSQATGPAGSSLIADGQPFAFAGLWTIATPKDADDPITSCSIITTDANDDVRFVHDRMPVILNGSDAEAAWLDPT